MNLLRKIKYNQKLCHYMFIAEPIYTTDRTLLGVEMLTRFFNATGEPLDSFRVISGLDVLGKNQLLRDQINQLKLMQWWFEQQDVYCSVNIDFDMACFLCSDKQLSSEMGMLKFVCLEISENFPGLNLGKENTLLKHFYECPNPLWLDDLGNGDANLMSLMDNCFDVVKVDKHFFWDYANKAKFSTLIGVIQRFCPRVIVEGVDNADYLPFLHECDVWGVQGYLYPSAPFEQLNQLIECDYAY